MSKYLFIACSVVFLIFASCEDTQKKAHSNTPDTSKASVVKKNSINPDSVKINYSKPKVKLSDEPLITQEELIPFLTKYGKENPETKIRIKTRFGDILVRLFKDTPLHRANFIFLTKHGYFNDTYFHRVAKGFVDQGGNSDNPSTNRKRHNIGSYLIPSEFSPHHTHVRGAFSAAKYAKQNVSKASSPYEFFIVQSHRGAHHLDNEHTVFGEVIKGMDVVDTINNQPVDESEWPLKNIRMDVEVVE